MATRYRYFHRNLGQESTFSQPIELGLRCPRPNHCMAGGEIEGNIDNVIKMLYLGVESVTTLPK